MRKRTIGLVIGAALSANAYASEVRTIEEMQAANLKTAPIDVKTLAPLQKLMELPSAPVVNLGVGTLPSIDAAAALQPIQTIPALPQAELAAPRAANLQPVTQNQTKGVQGSIGAFADRLAKDEKTTGGEQGGALSGAYFDHFMALSQDQAIPHAEGVARIAQEIEQPPELLRAKGIQGTVSVYGSARIPSPEEARAQYQKTIQDYGRKPKTAEGRAALKAARLALKNSEYYQLARRFGELVAKGGRGKVAVVTGGGPGIMEAANRGAFEAGGPSVGYNIKLPHEQDPNRYVTPGLSYDFENFTSRKMNLRHGALALVYFPGGFGTMDEFFENLTLMQTGKIARRPIVLVGKKAYWDEILDFKKFAKMGMISPKDLELFRYAETAEEAWSIVRSQRAGA